MAESKKKSRENQTRIKGESKENKRGSKEK